MESKHVEGALIQIFRPRIHTRTSQQTNKRTLRGFYPKQFNQSEHTRWRCFIHSRCNGYWSLDIL